MLIDTCYSGQEFGEAMQGEGLGKGLFDQKEVNRFAAGDAYGLYIIAASSDEGLAREREGNGLFTAALLEGLGGAADADRNGYVEVEELRSFASRVVHERSGGTQRPTVPTVRAGENFPVVKLND